LSLYPGLNGLDGRFIIIETDNAKKEIIGKNRLAWDLVETNNNN
jgi:hypothetical protein